MELILIRNIILAASAASALSLATLAAAQSAPTAPPARQLPAGAQLPLAAGEGRTVAEKLATELTDNFVYADHGKRYADMLRANALAGRYDIGTRHELAKRMTDDL